MIRIILLAASLYGPRLETSCDPSLTLEARHARAWAAWWEGEAMSDCHAETLAEVAEALRG